MTSKYNNSTTCHLVIKKVILLLFLIFYFNVCFPSNCFDKPLLKKVQAFSIAYVPASFPVNFSLFTSGAKQYVAFYDTLHQMTMACRNLSDSIWDFCRLDSKVEWDSHNYLTLFIDDEGYLHLAGNMHSGKLVYFRSSIPFDIHSMLPLHKMTGTFEDVTTYPVFMRGPNGELIFHYRYGRSGAGFEVFNIWNPIDQKWSHLIDEPLTDGRGQMNAYMQGPVLGPDGFFHLIWVWRNTPDCATNHTLSYARSKDLIHWENIAGKPTKLPITVEDINLYVDTTHVNGGLINIGIKLGFDAKGKVLIGYHKYDSSGNTQLYLARYEDDIWKKNMLTTWKYRWDFKGYGTIINELLIEAPKPSARKGFIVFGYHHIKYGDGQIVVEEKSLIPIDYQPIEIPYPKEIDSLQSAFPGMVVNKVFDSGKTNDGKNYLLRWETLPPNRDQKREDILPKDSILELIIY